jgi:S1-C subfamily serine protease
MVFRQELRDGDVLQFGAGGPTARLLATDKEGAIHDTVESARLAPRRTFPSMTAATLPGLRQSRELLQQALQRMTMRTRRIVGLFVITAVVGFAGVIAWQQRNRTMLEQRLLDLSSALATERASRATLTADLGAVQSRYDSLRSLVVRGRPARADATTPDYSRSVALIVFSYGYTERGSSELLRYVVDGQGQPIGARGPDGSFVPAIRFGGDGPPLVHEGTASGFLVDSAGLLLSNRHVAEPWAYEDELETMRAHGVNAVGKLLSIRAYFPPGDQSFALAVDAVSDHADVAVMHLVGGTVKAAVIPLAPREQPVRPGDRLRLIGYPTGVYNLLFRMDEAERKAIMEKVGDDSHKLVDELAGRKLIQPLVTDGSVSDTTGLEVIHTAATTVGGSGGPLLDDQLRVVAIQHASVKAPTAGDPFRTQRAVPIRFAWEILPRRTAAK